MPITPFHFGAGAALHAVAPRRVSFLAFCVANCLTDCETIYNVLWGGPPLHRLAHTFVGATVLALATTGLFIAARKLATRTSLPDPFHWQRLQTTAVAIGATLGTYSHIVLDGIMHADVRPFAPWRDDNPFYRMIGVGALHWSCVIAGAIGVAMFFLRDAYQTRRDPPV